MDRAQEHTPNLIGGRPSATALPHAATPRGRITASFGGTALVPDHDQAADRLVEADDDALYRAKTAGRDRVWPAPPETAAGEGAPGGTGDR